MSTGDSLRAIRDAWEPQPTLDEPRAGLRARLDAGFAAHDTPATGPLTGRTLRTRDLTDRSNWLTSGLSYQAAVAAAPGDVVNASFRIAGTGTVTLTCAGAAGVLVAKWPRGAAALRALMEAEGRHTAAPSWLRGTRSTLRSSEHGREVIEKVKRRGRCDTSPARLLE